MIGSQILFAFQVAFLIRVEKKRLFFVRAECECGDNGKLYLFLSDLVFQNRVGPMEICDTVYSFSFI